MAFLGMNFSQVLVFLLFLYTTQSKDECFEKGSKSFGAQAVVLGGKGIFSEDYEAELPPNISSCPAKVFVEFWPIAMGRVSVSEMSFAVDLYILFRWYENRISIPPAFQNKSTIILNKDLAERLWTPVVSLRNCIDCTELTFDKNTNKVSVSKHPTDSGLVILWYLDRVSQKYRCDYDLTSYPMDVQQCSIEVQALDLRSDLNLVDETKSHEFMSQSKPPNFEIVSTSSGECRREDHFSITFDCVEFVFTLRRQIGHHVMLTYIPSILIVSLSWISFWLDPDAAAPRVTLCLTTLLTLATQFANAQKNLPAVAYLKAIDVWMFTCMFLVVGSLVEFAIANTVVRRMKENPKMKTNNFEIQNGFKGIRPRYRRRWCETNPRMNFAFMNIRSKFSKKSDTVKDIDSRIDRVCRIAFPSVFLIFNIIYWVYYSNSYFSREF